MRYIEISNIGVISKQAIELLGFSDKRDRADLIGEKGTGLKFSRLQCLRKGIQMFVSTDEFINSYTKKNIDSANDQVIFKYQAKNGKTHHKPSSYTVQAGFSDWTDDWYIVREVIQNAVDETKRGGLCQTRNASMEFVCKSIRIVDKVGFAKKGNTNIYIEATPEIEKVFTNLEEYFVYNPIFECEYGSLHVKSNKDKIKIYKQGIFVADHGVYEGLYDYECLDLPLAENRTPQHISDVADIALQIYSLAPIKIKREFLRYAKNNKNCFELKQAWDFTHPLHNIDSWVEAFHAEFGENTVIHYEHVVPDHVAEKLEMHKYQYVIFDKVLYDFLKAHVQTLEDLTSSYDELQYHKEIPSGDIKELIDRAVNLAKNCFRVDVPVNVFTPVTNLEVNTAGVYLPRRKEVLLNKNYCTSLEQIMPILLEEFLHAETGAEDFSRAFQNGVLERLARVLISKYE